MAFKLTMAYMDSHNQVSYVPNWLAIRGKLSFNVTIITTYLHNLLATVDALVSDHPQELEKEVVTRAGHLREHALVRDHTMKQ